MSAFVVKPLPVLYACQGCAEFGETARQVGMLLDWKGVVETVWLGAPKPKHTMRFPVVALDGCAKACAREWLERGGTRPVRSYLLEDRGEAAAERMASRISAELGGLP